MAKKPIRMTKDEAKMIELSEQGRAYIYNAKNNKIVKILPMED